MQYNLNFISRGSLPAFISVHHVHAWPDALRPKEGSVLGTRVIDGCELPCLCWESNLGLLEEQPALLASDPLSSPPKALRL